MPSVAALSALAALAACGGAPAEPPADPTASAATAGIPTAGGTTEGTEPGSPSSTVLGDPARPVPATPTAVPSAADPSAASAGLPSASPRSGTGRTEPVPIPAPDSSRSGRPMRYAVEVEGGLGIPGAHVAATVHRVLTHERGWEVRDRVHFVGVDPEERDRGAGFDLRIIVASPAYVDRNCLPLRTMGELSCRSGNRVLLNADRYLTGIPDYRGDIDAYRTYLISHEVGHILGHGHVSCPGPGRPAPVMMQQSKGLDGCLPYPYPVAGG